MQMALLELVMPWKESFIVVESFDCRSLVQPRGEDRTKKRTVIIGVGPEEMTEYPRVRIGIPSPHFPHLITHRVCYEVIFRPLHDVVRTHINRLRVRVFGGIQWLSGEKTEMFSPE